MTIRKNITETCAELERIAKANKGVLTPEAVVKNAQSERSPIHKYFTWDDTEAAKKMRLMEASMLIRSVRVNVEMHDQDEPISTRAFINVAVKSSSDENKPGVYVPLDVALKVDDYKTQMLENAASELSAFRRKYAVLRELAGVFSAIDKLQMEFTK